MDGLKIALLGYGMVGEPFAKWIQKNTDHHVFIHDPAKGFPEFHEDLRCCFDCYVLCLPAPTNKEMHVDLSIIKQVLDEQRPQVPVFIKSTVPVGTCDRLTEIYKTPVCHLPEFLTERTRFKDMDESDVIVGLSRIIEVERLNCIDLIERIFVGKSIQVVRNEEAELIKYVHNCFGAMKVSYFNWVCDFCERQGLDYNSVVEGVLMSGLIDKNHTQVPGPDGKYGYGGACFPKDVDAFKKQLVFNSDEAYGPDNWMAQLLANITHLNRIFRPKKTGKRLPELPGFLS